jgi:hypothetical protein
MPRSSSLRTVAAGQSLSGIGRLLKYRFAVETPVESTWLLWKYCQTRNQVALREVGELGFSFYFILLWRFQMSLYSKFCVPSSEITGFIKGSTGDQITGNVLVANRWTHTGVRDPRLFR